MPIQLLAAPPASGKTEYCIQRIRQAVRQHPHKDFWVLVAEGSQALQFRQRLAHAGGMLGVQVVSFDNLLREILEVSGLGLPLAPSALVHAFIRGAVEKVSEEGGLEYYAAIRDKPGFTTALQSVFSELKRGLVYPEQFSEYTASGGQAQQEIGALYMAYQFALRSANWADPAGLSWLAVEFLETHPDWKPDWPLLVLDGFDSFTRPQLKALALLKARVPEILITLPGSPAMERSVHRRFMDTLTQLNDLGAELILDAASSVHLPAAMKHLEANLHVPEAPVSSTGESILFLEAPSPAAEAREVLRWIKHLIVREGVDAYECAIIVPDMLLYRPHLKAVSEEFGVPLAFSCGEPLVQTPLYRSLRALLQLPVQDYPRRLLLEVLRSPDWDLTRFGLGPDTALHVDLLSCSRQVTGGKEAWLESLAALAAHEGGHDAGQEAYEEGFDDEGLPALCLPAGKDAEALQVALDQFFNRIEPKLGELPLPDWVGWLEDLLEEVNFWSAGSPQVVDETRPVLRQLLRELVLAAGITHARVLSYAGFLDALHQAVEAVELPPANNFSQRAVNVIRTIEGRGVRRDAVALVGLSEGIFPRRQLADPFLDERMRAGVGLASAFDPNQLGLFYQAVTRANLRLLLTRPYLAPDGEHWQPSPFWDAARKLFQEEALKVRPEKTRLLDEAGSAAELMAWAEMIPPELQKTLQARAERVTRGRIILQARQAKGAASPYQGLLFTKMPLPEVWSASGFESYLTCPQFYFTQRLLELQPKLDPEPGMDIAQRGSLLHSILERVFSQAEEPTNLDCLLSVLETAAAEAFDRAPLELGFRPGPLWGHEQSELKSRLEETIRALHAKSDGWEPIQFEAVFGMQGSPPLALQIDGTPIRVRGVIDRVDRSSDGELRIIDYKTGSSKFGKSILENGERLQLALYALAARDALGLGEPTAGFYWSINQAAQSSFKIQRDDLDLFEGILKAHIRRVLDGIQRGDFAPDPPKEGCMPYCPGVGWCWTFQAGRRVQ